MASQLFECCNEFWRWFYMLPQFVCARDRRFHNRGRRVDGGPRRAGDACDCITVVCIGGAVKGRGLVDPMFGEKRINLVAGQSEPGHTCAMHW
ncbi:hypothetical protein WJ62_21680 [Burkholderia diffusa]|nr:hypothetical protein WJ62_21680 [Burkholderia diffusa]